VFVQAVTDMPIACSTVINCGDEKFARRDLAAMELLLSLLAFATTSVTVLGTFSPYLHDRFCVDRTGFAESFCREIYEGVFRCHLPIETSMSQDISLDCSNDAMAIVARKYERQAKVVRRFITADHEANYYPISYIDFLVSSDDYSEINKRFLFHRSKLPAVAILSIAQISMLTSRNFYSTHPSEVPVEDILGLRTLWRYAHPSGSERIPLMRGHTFYNDSVEAFNATLRLLYNKTNVDSGLLILDHLLIDVPRTLARLIAMGQMHIMGRFDFRERTRYLSILSDCLDAFQMMNDFGGDRAVPYSLVEFVAHAAISKDIRVVQRFHHPKLFVDTMTRNVEVGPGFENLRCWGFLTNDVAQYLHSYIQSVVQGNTRETYGLESLTQVDLSVISTEDYDFYLNNLRADCPRISEDLERDVLVKYVNFLARRIGLSVPPEETIDYIMGRDIMDLIPATEHHALTVLYKAIYCLDQPHMIFVILKLIRFSNLEIYEYIHRNHQSGFEYKNTEYFESPAVDHEVSTQWQPDDVLVQKSILHLCRSLYRCLGSRVGDSVIPNQDMSITANAIADQPPVADDDTR